MRSCRRVFVYRNLHRQCFSVKCIKTGRVIAHVDALVLENAEFRVSQAGRKRVLMEKRKNVHAGIVGIWRRNRRPRRRLREVTYNPYRYTSFVDKKTEVPVSTAKVCVIQASGVTI